RRRAVRLRRHPDRGAAVRGHRRTDALRLHALPRKLAVPAGRAARQPAAAAGAEAEPAERIMPDQLSLGLTLPVSYAREDFLVAPGNAAALAWIDRWPDWPNGVLILYGQAGSGKTHLAQIWASRT